MIHNWFFHAKSVQSSFLMVVLTDGDKQLSRQHQNWASVISLRSLFSLEKKEESWFLFNKSK